MPFSFRTHFVPHRVSTAVGILLATVGVPGCGSGSDPSDGGSGTGGNGTGGNGTGGASAAVGGHATAGTAGAVGAGGSTGSAEGGSAEGGSSGSGGLVGQGGFPGGGGAVGSGGFAGVGGAAGSGGLTGTGGAAGYGGRAGGGGTGPAGGAAGHGGVPTAGSGGSSNAGATTIAAGGSSAGGDVGAGGTTIAAGGAGDDLCDVGVWDGTAPDVLDTGLGVHDPTMIQEDGTFYVLWTGDYIPVATSTNLRDFRISGSIYGGDYPAWVDAWLSGISGEEFEFPWAPDVVYFGGKYHLYATFSAVFGDNISCITHLTASHMQGPFTDHGPVICTEGSEHYNAIDPDVALDAEGTPWLAFGSFWDGIMAFELDQEGNRVGTGLTRLANNSSIEAPVLLRRCGYYYLFVSWGTCCKGADSTYNVRVGRSENITGPYYAKDGTPMLEGGGSLMVEGDGVNFAAAGHSEVIVVGDKIYHFYHAYRQSNGDSVLRIAEMPFDDDGWPVAAGP